MTRREGLHKSIFLMSPALGGPYKIHYDIPDKDSIWDADTLIHDYRLGLAIVAYLRQHHTKNGRHK